MTRSFFLGKLWASRFGREALPSIVELGSSLGLCGLRFVGHDRSIFMCDKDCTLTRVFSCAEYRWLPRFGPHRVLLSWAAENSRFLGGVCCWNARQTRALFTVFRDFSCFFNSTSELQSVTALPVSRYRLLILLVATIISGEALDSLH